MIGRAALLLYTLCLRAFPAHHRARYGREMLELFEREHTTLVREQGASAALRFTVDACFDAVSAGWGERRRETLMQSRFEGNGRFVGIGLDLRHGLRALTKSWTFTAVCLTSLAIGIAINAILLLFMQQTFDPPRGVRAEGAVGVLVLTRGLALEDTWSYPEFLDLKNANTGIDLTAYGLGTRNVRRDDGADGGRVGVMYVSANYFRTLGMNLPLGRGFMPEEDTPVAAGASAVISDSLWKSRFGGDPAVIGRELTLNRTTYRIVGVTPRGYDGHYAGNNEDVWLPLWEHPLLRPGATAPADRSAERFEIIGRLREGVTIAQADAAIKGVMQNLAQVHPATNAERSAVVVPYTVQGEGDAGRVAKTIFFALSGMVLLVVCMNVAGMVLVRTAAREKELALHLAIGASRLRLVRHLMTESAIIALASSVLSIAFVWAVLRLVAWWMGTTMPDDLMQPVVKVCLGLSFAAMLAIGLSPALKYTRPEILPSLKDDVGGGRRRSSLIHRIATSVQTAVALPMLVVNLVVLQATKLMDVADYGFDQEQLLVGTLDLDADGMPVDQVEPFLRQLREQVATVSGVESVSVADALPLDYGGRARRLSRQGEDSYHWIQGTRVDERYFETIGTPLLRGRAFHQGDRLASEPVAIVTQSLAELLWPGEDALGRRVTYAFDGRTQRDLTIVGVVADVVGSSHESEPTNLYAPIWQHPTQRAMLVVRTPTDAVAPAIAAVAGRIDPALTKPAVVTARSLMAASKWEIHAGNTFIAGLCLLTLLLAALGVYGVIAFAVTNRTREIGVRMAVGASRQHVIGMVLGDGVKLALPGVAVGTVLAIVIVQAVLSEWYAYFDRSAIDPAILGAGIAVALSVVVFASSMPARRAASVRPMEALRHQ